MNIWKVTWILTGSGVRVNPGHQGSSISNWFLHLLYFMSSCAKHSSKFICRQNQDKGTWISTRPNGLPGVSMNCVVLILNLYTKYELLNYDWKKKARNIEHNKTAWSVWKVEHVYLWYILCHSKYCDQPLISLIIVVPSLSLLLTGPVGSLSSFIEVVLKGPLLGSLVSLNTQVFHTYKFY